MALVRLAGCGLTRGKFLFLRRRSRARRAPFLHAMSATACARATPSCGNAAIRTSATRMAGADRSPGRVLRKMRFPGELVTPSAGLPRRLPRACRPRAFPSRRLAGSARSGGRRLLRLLSQIAEPHALRQSGAGLSVVRSNHRVIVRQAPFLPVFLRAQIEGTAKMTLQRLESFTVF